MAYLSLYRKYRPQTFAQVMGQEHVVQTLQNALRYGHVANGYLFCGTRGVAKTTLARILAKCLNCIGPSGDLTAPQPEPCNQCGPCLSIQGGHCVDVVEMDAASNRSVSDIARLRENVQFGPMETRYKVYIVDEAHQLTSDAKDAFLKTLEEPPANVIFILATTEAHAIPITIASRCQQFDFRRGSIQQIAEQCKRVLAAEGVTMPDDAVAIVARAAEGSYRDALSLLDQVLAYKREGITAHDVSGALGTVEGELIDRVLLAVSESDQAQLFALADEIYLHGKDVRQFLKAVGARLRDLLYIRSGAHAEGVLESGVDAVAAATMAKLFPPQTIVAALEIVTEADRHVRFSDQHRLLLEMTLLKMNMTGTAPVTAQPATQTARPSRPVEPKPVPRPAVAVVQNGGQTPPAAKPAINDVDETIAAVAEIRRDLPEGDPDAVLHRLKASWAELINFMHAKYPKGVAFVQDAYPTAVKGTVIVLQFANKMSVDMLQKPARREVIEKAICRILGQPEGTFKIECTVGTQAANQSLAPKPAATVVLPPAETPAPMSFTMDDDEPSPVLDEVMKVFGGRIIEEE